MAIDSGIYKVNVSRFWKPMAANLLYSVPVTALIIYFMSYFKHELEPVNIGIWHFGWPKFKFEHYFIGIILTIIAALYTAFKLVMQDIVTSLESTDKSIDLVARISIHIGLDKLATAANTLPRQFRHHFAEMTNSLYQKGGGIIVHCMQKNYLEHLDAMLNAANDSIFFTMRGGEKPTYYPAWFFQDDALPSAHKLKWLRDAKDAQVRNKIRVLLFDESEPEFREFFLNRKRERNIFLTSIIGKAHPTSVYLVSPRHIHDVLRQNYGEEECHIAFDDFAIFEKSIVLKHNGAATLTVSIQSQIDLYNEFVQIFEQLDESCRKEITVEKFGDLTWEEWEQLERSRDEAQL